jgi:hypothetical protein
MQPACPKCHRTIVTTLCWCIAIEAGFETRDLCWSAPPPAIWACADVRPAPLHTEFPDAPFGYWIDGGSVVVSTGTATVNRRFDIVPSLRPFSRST